MNRLKVLYMFLLLTGCIQLSIAQPGVNRSRTTAGNENTPPDFIDGISFTPDGILQTTESGGTKSIKSGAAPLVIKSNADRIVTTDEPRPMIETLAGIQFKYAMLLDVAVESLKDLSLFGFIENWMGTRYRMGGTTKEGIDCSALTSSILMAVYGFVVPRTARQQYKAAQHIKKNSLKQGDLVFFNTRGGVSHVGLYLDNDYFVHSCSRNGVTISSLNDNYYAKRFICGGRVGD